MGFFSNLRIANWQAKVAAKASVYLEESFGGPSTFDADNVANTLLKVAWSYESRYFNPKDPLAPSVLPLVAFVLACGADDDSPLECSPEYRKVVRKALGTVLAEIEDSTNRESRSMVDNELVIFGQKTLEAAS